MHLVGQTLEETYEKSLSREIFHLQPMWLCICYSNQLEETFENSLWRKLILMQPVWLCICWVKLIEETFENSLWRKPYQWDFTFGRADTLRTHLKRHTEAKPYKCNQCNYASGWAEKYFFGTPCSFTWIWIDLDLLSGMVFPPLITWSAWEEK